MNLVMFHSGLKLPVFLEYTFKQIRLFNPKTVIYFITDKALIDNSLFEKYEITSLDKDLFYSDKIKQFEGLYNYPPNHFWTITATRLIYIENFLKEYKLTDVYHFENDILLYYNLEDYHEKFQSLYEYMAITPGGPDRNITGFMFIKNWESLSDMTQYFINTIRKHSMKSFKRTYKIKMIHEMGLMKIYEIERGLEYLSYLPILPFGKQASNYDIFNSIFDPASWGQFVGGTRKDRPGYKTNLHYIGQLLIANPDYTVIWKRDVEGRNIPYFKYRDNEVKINNLHIHSKNLHKYMSND